MRSELHSTKFRMKNCLIKGLLLFGSLALLELGLHLMIKRTGHVATLLGKPWYFLVPFDVPKQMPDTTFKSGAYRRYDPTLGWTIGEGGKDAPLYFADARGFRIGEAEYAVIGRTTNAAAEPEIVCIGDSFTHGDEVKNEDTRPFQLANLTKRSVVNLGVGGYGVDQAILRYRESGLKGGTVFLGLIAGDFERATTPIYSFTTGGLKTKPVMQFAEGRLTLANQPALHGEALRGEFEHGSESEFFRLDAGFDRRFFQRGFTDYILLWRIPKSALVWRAQRKTPIYRTADDRFHYAMEILKYAKELTAERQARLIVVLLDNLNTFADRKTDTDPWQRLRTALTANAIYFIDTTPAIYEMYQASPESVINAGLVHYTPMANRRVAEVIAAELSKPSLVGAAIP